METALRAEGRKGEMLPFLSLYLTLSESQLNELKPRFQGQRWESRISEISSCTADGFFDGSEERQAPATSLSNLLHSKRLSLKRQIVKLIIECYL